MKRAIHWFRRDLRISDNHALFKASQQAQEIIPVFVIEEGFKTGPDVGAARVNFLLQALRILKQQLAVIGLPLIVRSGRSEEVIPKLALETASQAVFCNKRYEPYAVRRDQRLFNSLNQVGVGFFTFKDAVIFEETDVVNLSGRPYTVFTPYARMWKSRAIPSPFPQPEPRPSSLAKYFSEEIPDDSSSFGYSSSQPLPDAGETAAEHRMKEFFEHDLKDYGTARNLPGINGTSGLSPYLRCGNISPRTIIARLNKERSRLQNPGEMESLETFLKELIWREFYLQILANFPHVSRGAFRTEYDALGWSASEEYFHAWKTGQTGFPIVDAAMRCLNQTGWMHNRLRMITAMFLTKDLMIHWQSGERYFMQQLIDGDMACNNGGWQWCAGTGTDAAPYFRIFNPTSQSKTCDPSGKFIRRWIPELNHLNPAVIHEPSSVDRRGIYPEPIIDHKIQRKRCLNMYAEVFSRRKNS